MMEAAGVAIDGYTVSIMMKSLKNQNNQNNVSRTLALLDRSGLDAWSDEIMLNTVLETCIKHREFQRLQAILSRYGHQSMLPSAHTYAVLIKAYGALKLVDGCYKMWNELVVTRAIEPSDLVLGCMLHALVCNRHVDEAVDLYRKFKSKIQSSTVICSTLMKGFVNCRQGDRAIAMWREMREGGMAANTVLYNTVIDSQARAGAMDRVSEVFAAMKEKGQCHTFKLHARDPHQNIWAPPAARQSIRARRDTDGAARNQSQRASANMPHVRLHRKQGPTSRPPSL